MGLKDVLAARLAGQLRGPHGLYGRLVAGQLNKVNLRSITAAIDELHPSPGDHVADIGFGGGVGLELLLDRVGPEGVVHGVDPMSDMVAKARRGQRGALQDGRLALHEATMDRLPIDDGVIGGVISCNTIYFMDDLGPGFAELSRIMSPGGIVVIGVADPEELRNRPFADHGFIVREIDDVADQLESAGFTPPVLTPVSIDRGTFLLLRTTRRT
jgi:ubiquinone/menaquinone biosynthesis C-methylase UbiE